MSKENPGSKAPARRAIVLIPGFKREERFFRRDVLVKNLETVEQFPVRTGDPVEAGGEAGQRMNAQPLRTQKQTRGPDLDVFECYWVDMIPEQAELGPWRKLLRGFELMFYWLFHPRFVLAPFNNPYLTLGLVLGGILLVLWYISLAVLVAGLIGNDPTLASGIGELPAISWILDKYERVAGLIGNWEYWVVVVFVLSTLQVEALVQLAYFTKDYFENKRDETEVGLRDRVRQRVSSTLENVLRRNEYAEVFVVAHSFGTIIAVDILADWPHEQDFDRIRLVTLGSPIAVLRHRSKWLESQRQQLLGKDKKLPVWLDFHARSDWLCTAFPDHGKKYGQASSKRLMFEARWLRILTGRTHMLYYHNQTVLTALAAPVPQGGT